MNYEHYALMASGKKYYYRKPKVEDILIEDIASGLSKECRFNGQCRGFYSVAQHSILVSYIVPPAYALVGLLHDAAEAYLKDLPSPLKRSMEMESYNTLTKLAENAIFDRFGLGISNIPNVVKRADLVALATEKRDLTPYDAEQWPCLEDVEPLPMKIEVADWVEARRLFMQRFEQLCNKPVNTDNVIPIRPLKGK